MINKTHLTISAILFALCLIFCFLYFSIHLDNETKDDLYTEIREYGNPHLTVQVKLSEKYNSINTLSIADQEHLSKTKGMKSIGVEIIKTLNNPKNILVPKKINAFVMPQDNITLGEIVNLVLTNSATDSNSVDLYVGCGFNTSRHVANFYLEK